MPPSSTRDYISPFVQPPLNRLFVSRPTPDFMPSVDKGKDGWHGPRVSGVASFMAALDSEDGNAMIVESAKELKARLKSDRLKEYHAQLASKILDYKPKENVEATSDPLKTIIVARLSYDIDEKRLKREFERYGAVKSVKMIYDKESGEFRGYAFIEFEREKDVKSAYADADGLKINGRRVVVDVERGRTVPDWLPRRLGGGLGRTRVGSVEQNQRYSGRDPRTQDHQSNRAQSERAQDLQTAGRAQDHQSGAKRPRSRSRSPRRRHH